MTDILFYLIFLPPLTYVVFLAVSRLLGQRWTTSDEDDEEEERGEENGDEFEARPIILPDESPREVKCQYCGTKFIETRCPTCNAPRR